jgi:hypothetical protein
LAAVTECRAVGSGKKYWQEDMLAPSRAGSRPTPVNKPRWQQATLAASHAGSKPRWQEATLAGSHAGRKKD